MTDVTPAALLSHRRLLRRPLSRALSTAAALACLGGFPVAGQAAVALLQPTRVVDGTRPLTLTLLVTADAKDRSYLVPETLTVIATADLQAPVTLTLRRATPGPTSLRLRRGEHRTIDYSAPFPADMRGQVRLEPRDIDAAPVLVSLNRAPAATTSASGTRRVEPEGVSAADASAGQVHDQTTSQAAAPVALTPIASAPPLSQADPSDRGRLTFNDPMYFLVGAHGGANAKMQFSFKFRIYEGKDPASNGLLENLYLGYTQFSLWDLGEESKPFRDTNYRPSLFYYLSDTGVRNGVISRLSFAGGLEHESNGKDGADSRSVNTAFIKPTFYLGDVSDWHWTVTPKIYYYIEKSNNPDIANYRGYADLKLAYGKPDAWEFAATVRKGTHKWYGSVDAQVSYPLGRIIPGTAGFLMAGYFAGYGESLLDYNRKLPWQFRLGYALNR